MRGIRLATVGLSLASMLGCGASPPPVASVERTSSPTPVDPLTGLIREPPAEGFASSTSEHLCTATEDVIFACKLEGTPPQAVTSLCLKKGSPRNDPVVIGRERVDGRTEEPFAGQASQLMITVLEMGGVAFSVEAEQRASGGAFGVEKQTDPKSPNKPPLYRRNMTLGKGDAAKSMHGVCDSAHPITDNLESLRAYKL